MATKLRQHECSNCTVRNKLYSDRFIALNMPLLAMLNVPCWFRQLELLGYANSHSNSYYWMPDSDLNYQTVITVLDPCECGANDTRTYGWSLKTKNILTGKKLIVKTIPTPRVPHERHNGRRISCAVEYFYNTQDETSSC